MQRATTQVAPGLSMWLRPNKSAEMHHRHPGPERILRDSENDGSDDNLFDKCGNQAHSDQRRRRRQVTDALNLIIAPQPKAADRRSEESEADGAAGRKFTNGPLSRQFHRLTSLENSNIADVDQTDRNDDDAPERTLNQICLANP